VAVFSEGERRVPRKEEGGKSESGERRERKN